MKRREFGMMGLAAAAVAALDATAFAQPGGRPRSGAKPAQGGGHHHHAPDMECAKACAMCSIECDSCANHCAMMVAEGKKEHLTTLAHCQDCADICAAAQQVAARGGPLGGVICLACADACAKCAEECEKFPDDEHMARCAKECRKCEKECREMLKEHGHEHADA